MEQATASASKFANRASHIAGDTSSWRNAGAISRAANRGITNSRLRRTPGIHNRANALGIRRSDADRSAATSPSRSTSTAHAGETSSAAATSASDAKSRKASTAAGTHATANTRPPAITNGKFSHVWRAVTGTKLSALSGSTSSTTPHQPFKPVNAIPRITKRCATRKKSNTGNMEIMIPASTSARLPIPM